jgi:hypothetical protein
MSDPTEEAIEAIKGMGLYHDEEDIREALRRCNNNAQEAVQLLLPESPTSETNMSLLDGYQDHPPPHYGHEISTDSRESYDVDMRDTETHPSPGADSDHDSTTVSYSLEEDTIQDIEEEERSARGREEEEEEERFRPLGQQGRYHEYGPHRHDGPPPRYEDIVDENQDDPVSSSPPLLEEGEKAPTPTPPEMSVAEGTSVSIEFPLTHYYELESRVHTEQWSIPYKRDESLAICMVATTRMILEGKWEGGEGGRREG